MAAPAREERSNLPLLAGLQASGKQIQIDIGHYRCYIPSLARFAGS